MNDLFKLQQKLIYSFKFSFENVSCFLEAYLETDKKQSVDSFSKDIIDKSDAGIFTSIKLFLSYSLVSIVQCFLLVFYVFFEKSDVKLAIISILILLFSDVVYLLSTRQESIYLKSPKSSNEFKFLLLSFVVLMLFFAVGNVGFMLKIMAPENIGTFSLGVVNAFLYLYFIVKLVLGFIRYSDWYSSALYYSSTVVIISGILYSIIPDKTPKFYDIYGGLIGAVPFVFGIIILVYILFKKRRGYGN